MYYDTVDVGSNALSSEVHALTTVNGNGKGPIVGAYKGYSRDTLSTAMFHLTQTLGKK